MEKSLRVCTPPVPTCSFPLPPRGAAGGVKGRCEGGRSRYPRTTSYASRSRPGGTYGTFRPGEEGLSVCLCVRLSKHTS